MTSGATVLTMLVQAPRRLLTGLVLLYRWTLKPWLGNACRFEPSCSQYALDALQQHGAVAGGGLTVWRLLRCHPWCEGGCDPVPARRPGLFAHLGLTPQDTAVSAGRRVEALTPETETVQPPESHLEPRPGHNGAGSFFHPSSKPPLS